MPAKGWTSISVRSNLCDKIDEAIKGGAEQSIGSTGQFVDLAIRKYLERLDDESGRRQAG